MLPGRAILNYVSSMCRTSTKDFAYQRRIPQQINAFSKGQPCRDEACQCFSFQRVNRFGDTLIKVMELDGRVGRALA
jgi:hypothetical protein